MKDNRIVRDSDGDRPSRRSNLDDEESVPRAAERRKVRSGRERVDVSSLGMMYCMVQLAGSASVLDKLIHSHPGQLHLMLDTAIQPVIFSSRPFLPFTFI